MNVGDICVSHIYRVLHVWVWRPRMTSNCSRFSSGVCLGYSRVSEQLSSGWMTGI